MASDWAKDVVGRKKREIENERLKTEKDLSDRKMLDGHCEPMWSEVRQAVENAIAEVNTEMGEQIITYVAGKDRDRITMRVGISESDIRLDRPRWTVIGIIGIGYKLSIVEGNGVMWKDSSGRHCTSEKLARDEVGRAINPRG